MFPTHVGFQSANQIMLCASVRYSEPLTDPIGKVSRHRVDRGAVLFEHKLYQLPLQKQSKLPVVAHLLRLTFGLAPASPAISVGN